MDPVDSLGLMTERVDKIAAGSAGRSPRLSEVDDRYAGYGNQTTARQYQKTGPVIGARSNS
jgi:hypothetical protein